MTARFAIQQADAIDWLRTLPPRSVDLIITDPAYESLEKHRAKGTTTRLTSWFPTFSNARYEQLFAELYRVLNVGHCYVLCDQETMFLMKPIAEAAGFTFWKPLVWDKVHIGMGYHWRAQYEFVLFFEKGKRQLNDLGASDVLRVPRIAHSKNPYPTEKPVELIRQLVRNSSKPGDVVLDCFTGSGSTGEAALTEGRQFVGCDIQSTSVELASSRLCHFGERTFDLKTVLATRDAAHVGASPLFAG